MDMTAWLDDWVRRHPLREPPALDRVQFTAEVMARVQTPEPVRLPVWRPQVRVALLAATAAIAVVLWLRSPAGPGEIAWMAERDLELLALVDDVTDVLPIPQAEALEDELRLLDTVLVTEPSPTDSSS